MLNLDECIVFTPARIMVANLCDQFSEEDLRRIGEECYAGYDADERSREVWMRRNEAGMDLALQIQKDKSFPWPGCANVAFPLITIAALQFHARAYPAIVGGDQVVKCRVFGEDPQGQKSAHADRVSTHMSWQLMYEDTTWEDQEDKALLNLSIVGTNFKKSYFSPSLGHNVSELVLAKDLVMNYWSKDVNSTPRKTHKIPKFQNEVYENVRRGLWRDVLDEPWYQSPPKPPVTRASAGADNRQGLSPPRPDDATALLFLEQHCDLDLDGDGYAEPYIVTLENSSRSVVRIVCRFNSEADIERVGAGPNKGKIIRVKADEYFTKKTFIPSPDGGIYDIGFGVFLGPLNEATNSLVNMLLDAGTMQTTMGGFLGRGAKIRGGTYTAAPFEWKRVDSTGDDLRKNIFPFPINAPSDVLFQLLSLLINYASRVSGTTDITVGENPGQNTPAQTTQTMVEMGQKIYTAIFKRIWRASREEFQKLFRLNRIYTSLDIPQPGGATRLDYKLGSETQIFPVADPNITSEAQKLQIAVTLKTAAASTPGYNKDEVEKRFLKTLHVDAPDLVFPGTKGAPPPPAPELQVEQARGQTALQVEQLRMQVEQAKLAQKDREFQMQSQQFIMKLQEEQRLNNATIVNLEAQAAMNAAKAEVEKDYAQAALINAQISQLKHDNEHINAALDRELKRYAHDLDAATRVTEAKLAAEVKQQAAPESVPKAEPAPTAKLPDIHVHLPSGNKKISKAADGSYLSQDLGDGTDN